MSRLDKPVLLPFGVWAPDQPEWRNTGAIRAKGVIARKGFYVPLRQPAVFSSAVDSAVRGGVGAIRSLDSVVFNIVGTATKLYSMNSTLGWGDVTRLAGGDYALTERDRWEFIQFGETLIGVDGQSDAPQSITLGAASFADLAGSPPRARHIGVIGSFVMLGNTLDTIDGARAQRAWWSGFNDAAYWTPDLARQCSFRDLVGEGGGIQRIIGGDYGTILRERSIARASYVGPPGVFQFDEIEASQGTDTPWSAVKVGRITYYHSADGFYAFDGSQSAPIGRDIVDQTFADDFQSAYPHNVIAGADRSRNIFWIYPGAGAVGGIPNKVLIYNPNIGQFTFDEFENEFLCPLYSSLPLTTDAVDSILTSTDVPGFVDDVANVGGNLLLAFFDTSHRVNFLTGANRAAEIDTGERRLNPMGRAFVEGLMPMIDTTSGVTVTALERDLLSASVTIGESDTVNDLGEANPRSDARFHRFRIAVEAGTEWRKADGVAITEMAAGGVA